ncbi:MAG: RHS repeat-associated core domain-containing protein, partial [Chloroflexota bacterium]
VPMVGLHSSRPIASITRQAASDYTYDANGNMTSGDGRTIAWDAENRPASVVYQGVTTMFVYDGDGKRVEKTVDDGVTAQTTVYVGNLYEKDLSTGEETKYYYAGDRRIAVRKGGTLSYILSDHLGGTWATVDPAGSNLQLSLYYPYARPCKSVSNGTTDRLFAGYRLDGSTGLYQVGGRYYDPLLARFLQPDGMGQAKLNDGTPFMPLTVSFSDYATIAKVGEWNRGGGKAPASLDPQLLNRYSYSRNNPTTYYDPSGKLVWFVPIIIGAVLIPTAGAALGAGAYALTHQDGFNWDEAAIWATRGTTVATAAAIAPPIALNVIRSANWGGLSVAAKYGGVDTYATLAVKASRSGYEVHHVIEQRFLRLVNSATGRVITESQMKSVVLTQEEHRAFTSAWRAAIGYDGSSAIVTTSQARLDQLVAAVRQVYADYPELLKVALQELGVE